MKKIFLALALIFIFIAAPAMAATKTAVKAPVKSAKTSSAKVMAVKPVSYKAVAPTGYTPITWASAPGINSYFKAPANSGALDFITRIYLPQNQIQVIISTTTPADYGPSGENFVATTSSQIFSTSTNSTAVSAPAAGADYRNLSFTRVMSEAAKKIKSEVKFLWDAPFFNMKSPSSDLSMALKYSIGTSTIITSGSRSVPDMNMERRMLIINNKKGTALIGEFNGKKFIDNKNGDQALEGFSPLVDKRDGASAARLFLGVSADGKELVVYCSQGATVAEASEALTAAGVKFEHQLEADGGGSASCGYNLPGQYFVEPKRSLPVLMGAVTILARGTVNNSTLNVRKGPSAKNAIAAKLSKGAEVMVYEEKNGWYRIGGGQWVLGTMIKKN